MSEEHVRQTHCFACGAEFKLVSPDDDCCGSEQYEDALRVTFAGGYGMYIESLHMNDDGSMFYGDPVAMICGQCADIMCSSVPWIDRLLKALGGVEQYDPRGS